MKDNYLSLRLTGMYYSDINIININMHLLNNLNKNDPANNAHMPAQELGMSEILQHHQ